MSTPLAPALESFFTDRLLCQKRVSPNTIASYRDTFRLLLRFAEQRTCTRPAQLELTQLDATMIGAFLDHLETQRGNSARTRNVRLGTIHSFFQYCALRHPEHAGLIARVLAIPAKRSERRTVTFLHPDETKALLDSPDRTTWAGRRDYALLLCTVQTGLRVSEVIGLTCADVELGTGAHLRAFGKGRKERIAPLTRQTVAVLKVWTRGTQLTRDALERRLAKHLQTARQQCSTLRSKPVTMHTLRHTAAMMLLSAGVDTSTIALWLGHEQERTTHIYLHADLAIKQRALDRATPPNGHPGRYRAPDRLLAFLEEL